MPQTCLCQKYPPELPINLDGSLPLYPTQSQVLAYPEKKVWEITELNKLKLDKTTSELQLVLAEAKSDYESNLILKFAHTHHNKIYKYIIL